MSSSNSPASAKSRLRPRDLSEGSKAAIAICIIAFAALVGGATAFLLFRRRRRQQQQQQHQQSHDQSQQEEQKEKGLITMPSYSPSGDSTHQWGSGSTTTTPVEALSSRYSKKGTAEESSGRIEKEIARPPSLAFASHRWRSSRTVVTVARNVEMSALPSPSRTTTTTITTKTTPTANTTTTTTPTTTLIMNSIRTALSTKSLAGSGGGASARKHTSLQKYELSDVPPTPPPK